MRRHGAVEGEVALRQRRRVSGGRTPPRSAQRAPPRAGRNRRHWLDHHVSLNPRLARLSGDRVRIEPGGPPVKGLRGGRGEAQIEAPVDSRRIGIEVAAEQVQAKASSGAVPSVEELALRAVMAAVAAAYPLCGRGDAAREMLDAAATNAMAKVLVAAACQVPFSVVACEGARDGADPLAVVPPRGAAALLYADPVDGTLNAARGGPRAFSALGIGRQPAVSWTYGLDDSISVFAVGGRTGIAGLFASQATWRERLAALINSSDVSVGTLNREDNIQILQELRGPREARFGTASRTGYRPTLYGPRVLCVGDATVTLPLECDVEFGRIGLVEAQLQAGLHGEWTGLIVSRDRILELPGGTADYLDRYIAARDCGDVAALAALFTSRELSCFARLGVDLFEIAQPLTQQTFGVGPGGRVVIAALRSDHDRLLPRRSTLLPSPRWDAATGTLAISALSASATDAKRHLLYLRPIEMRELELYAREWYQRRPSDIHNEGADT